MPLITDAIGRVLGGRYRLVSPLGAGASAQVFLAEDVSLQRHVAIKLLQPALANDQGFLKRFRAEARSAAALNHPNIARVFDWGEDSGGPYLVLEYLGGGSLLDLLERGVRLSVAQATAVAAQAARGLAHAHARGLVHRDVKPANLLFDDEGRVRVADFGVARALAEGAWTEPAGVAVGTARYAAPEQAQGLRLDGRADVYALALVTFESLTGYVPFVLDTPMGTLAARVGATLPGHGALGPLQPLLTQAAAPNMAARPDAGAFAARLESLAATLPRPAPLPLSVTSKPMTGGPPTMAGPATAPGAPTVADQGATGRMRAGADEVFDGDALEPPAVRRRDRGGGGRGRLPYVVGVIVLALALVAAGLVLALRNGVFTPSHPVPRLAGMTVVQAHQALSSEHLVLATSSGTSTSVRKGHIVSQDPSAGSSLKQGSAVRVIVSSGPPSERIPSLLGLGCNGAARLLAVNHLKTECPALATYSATVPVGEVVNWSYGGRVDAGHAPFGATVLVAVSKGPQPKIIPNVQGDTVAQAQAALQELGLQVTESTAPSTGVASGLVAGTNPPIGTGVPPGSTVTILVSSGPPTAQVPNLSGDTVAQAQAALQAKGLVLGSVFGPAHGSVFATVPEAGTTVPQGTAVNIYTA
jgi:eukaryotic-like serine/threonine-protein kinase